MKLYKTKKNCGKLLLGILAFCTGMILLTGCGSSSEQKQNKNEETAEENKEEDKVQIGLTVDSFVIERWIRDRDVFVATARELGAEVNVQDAGADVKEQISQIEYFINKQVDVIVVIARDCGALSDAIQKAQSAGIPVISYDRMVNNANTDLYISFDNRKVGEIMAQALVNALPQGGDVFMIQGSSSDNNVQMVKQGFDDMLADTDLHVVYEANCDGWTAELAAGYVEEALEKYPHVKGIMCGNDDIASQVVQVLAENQLAGNVVVVGQDGDLAACQRIVEGTQYMTAFKPIEDLARKAAKYAVEMGSGNRAGRMCITCIVFVFAIVMSTQIIKVYQKDQEYIAKQADLEQQLSAEQDRQKELEAYETYTKSQQYVEDVAKSKLGLLYDNEVVFKEQK